MVKKAQGALEFLMTYGWAFLVILIMIGALAYFGILNPTRFLPDRCDFGTQMLCKKDMFIIKSQDTGTISAQLSNNFGSPINTSDWSVSSDVSTGGCDACFDNDGSGDCDGAASEENVSLQGAVWPAGESRTLVVDCSAGSSLPDGDKVKFLFNLNWFAQSAGVQYEKSLTGEIYGSVEP